MLTERYGNANLSHIVLPRDKYRPFPKVGDRAQWEALDPDIRKGIIKEGEKHLCFEWPMLTASRYMEFSRNGNRSRYESIYFKRRSVLSSLVMAECIEDRGRFLDQIINGVWCICEESSWSIPAHIGGKPLPDINDPIIDLFAAETSALLSWVYYLLKDKLDAVNEIVSKRIRQEINERILNPFLNRNDFWWMGLDLPKLIKSQGRNRLNNWNPWCNSNCLTSFLLVEDNPERRAEAVKKVMRSLDCFIDPYPRDGGCDEGPSYWNVAGGALFDCLELLYSASEGKINLYNEPLIKEIGRYIYRTHIGGDYFINFADADAIVRISAYMVYHYGLRISDDRMMKFGAWAYQKALKKGKALIKSSRSMNRWLPALFGHEEIKGVEAGLPYVRDVWLSDIQVMAAREKEGSGRGFYLAAKGGHNDESHNHNDVGQFIVYFDGEPILIDAGVETYTKKTFSSERYDIWTMQSVYHNLPTVNGIQQKDGIEYKAGEVQYHAEDGFAEFSLDIAGAYPSGSPIKSWRRTCKLDRVGESFIQVTDQFSLAEASQDIKMSLLTLHQPNLESPGKILIKWGNEGVWIEYDSSRLNFVCEQIDIQDARLLSVWGDRIYRIILKINKPVSQDCWAIKIHRNKTGVI